MESSETLHFDIERVGSSKRRISSILKTPRKSVEAGLKELQEDKSKPTEKRSSRRVSFAATRNVVFFSKDRTSPSDEQTPSPSLTPMGSDSQDANRGIYDGFENLLKAPLQIPHQREKIQVYSDPVLPHGCNENTVLFGEDTACMDITHCHTIVIDKDSEKSGLNFTINPERPVSAIGKPMKIEDAMLKENICLFQSSESADFGTFLASIPQQEEVKNTRNEISCKARDQTMLFGEDTACMDLTSCHTVVIKNDSNATDFTKTDISASGMFNTMNIGSNMLQRNAVSHKSDTDTDFGLSLASLSKKKGPEDMSCSAVMSSSVPTQKVDSEGFLAKLNARHAVIDKENHPPGLSDCSVPKPQGFRLRKSTVLSTDYDFMDLTKNHTVAIDGRGFLQKQQVDMQEKSWALGRGNTNSSRLDCDGLMGSLKSPDPDDMELTKSQTAAVNISMDVPRSSLSNIRRGEMSVHDPNKTQIFSGDNVGMEFRGVIDFTAEQQNFPVKSTQPTESKFPLSICRGTAVQDAQPVSHQHRFHDFENDQQTVDPANTDDMEMTKSQTVVIDTKGCEHQRPSNTRKSLSTNRTVMFAQNDEGMEFTEAFTGQLEARELDCQIRSMDLKTNQFVSSGGQYWWETSPDSDDMEITKSQTVTIDSKHLNQERLVMYRKSLSTNRSVIFAQNDDDDEGMEMTEALTGHINATGHTENRGTEHDNQRFFTDPTLNSSADYKQERPVRWRKSLSANRTVMFSNDDCMEMTEALTGHINASSHIDRSGRGHGKQSMFTESTINPTVPSDGKCSRAAVLDSDDMEITKSQPVVIDFKDYNQEKPVKSRKGLATNKSVMFTQNNDGMELTEVFTGQIEPNSCQNKRECDIQNVSMDFKINKAYSTIGESDQTSQCVGVPLAKNQTIHQSQPYVEALCSEADDMEITKSQTVVIDSKNRRITGTTTLSNSHTVSHSSHIEIVRSQSELADSNQSVKGNVSNNSMRKSLSCVSSSLRNTMFENEPYLERKEAVSGNDMEITRSQTVVIDAKHKVSSEDNDPNVQSQPIDCRNNFFPMTDVTLPSSQASALQMSTACEEMEFTSGKAAALDSDLTEVSNCYGSSTKKFCPFESFISKSRKSEEITKSFVAGQKSFFPSLSVDNMELTSHKHVPTCSQVTRKSMLYVATESKSQCSSADANYMNMKSTHPLPDECDGTPPQELDPVDPVSESLQNEAIEASNSLKGQGIHYDRSASLCTDKNVGSAKMHPVSPEDQKATERRDPAALKEKSRRRSLQDLRSKLRRISQKFNAESVQSVVDSATVPLPCLDLSENVLDRPKTADASSCRNQMSAEVVSEQMDNVESTRNVSLPNNETKPFTTQLSFGGFLPKLPSRPKPVPTDPHASETTVGFKSNVLQRGPDGTSNLLDNFDEMDNINAEQFPEMSSEEDISEGVDDHGLMQTQGEDSHCNQPLTQDLEDDEFLSTLSVDKGLKRSCPDDGHDDVPLEQKKKQDVSPSEVTVFSFTTVRWDEKASNMMTKMIDDTSSSSNSTYLKSEATFESTNKYSHCDSQIEKPLDYEFDFHKKIEDESIPVREFLRHFGIDIVIHRSHQSSLPDDFSPNPTPQFKHLLKELYIYRPKQRVYEADCKKLTDMVEGLMPRMLQLDQPFRQINESLLPELANLSKEQLLTFGSKLKEKKVHFRKRSKMISHEMKVGMYSELVQTTQEAKQKLQEKMLETNTLLKDLDACIHDLEAELAAVDSALRVDQVHAQSEIQPVIQQELKRLDGAVAEKEGQIVLVESEKKEKAEKIVRLREEVKEIRKQTSVIHSMNEWKLSLKKDEKTQFSFLHKTLFLVVTHHPLSEILTKNGEIEQKLCSISFDFQLDPDKSECHTVMVHDLLSQLLISEKDWLKKYSNSRDIPMLLHEVSLAVSRVRLLGEEIHRLKRWGALRLGILEINCADKQVQILFSSLKAFVKFRLTLVVTCDYPFGGVKIQSFQNYIGNTRVDQIEDLFSSIEPAKGYLTKIIKAIHDHLLI